MLHPLFDPTELTDDQIYDKLNKAYQYLSQQERLGHMPTVESIKHTINALEIEKQTRFETQMELGASQENEEAMKPINLGTVANEDDNETR